jgi:transcription elongation GreA/GreB family factor
MGKALIGQRPGAEVQVPSEQGEVACRLQEVSGLPESIRAWAKGD